VLQLVEHTASEACSIDHHCEEVLDEAASHHHERSYMFALAMAQHDYRTAQDHAARAVVVAREQARRACDAVWLAKQATTIVSALVSGSNVTMATARQNAQVVQQLAMQVRNEAHAADAVAMGARVQEAQMLKALNTLLLTRLRFLQRLSAVW